MNNSKDSGKISIKRLIENNIYILKYAIHLDAKLVAMVFFANITFGLCYAFNDSYFIKFFIDLLMSDGKNIDRIILLLILDVVLIGLAQILEQVVKNLFQAKGVYLTGQIQTELIRRASEIDLICYDQKDYFDDFVVAAAQSEEMIIESIYVCSKIVQNFVCVVVLGGLIFSINSVVAIFPILGFIINMVTRFKIAELEYEYEIKKTRIKRKADYSKRVFYQPEYAKEIKLSHIEVPLRRQFNEAVTEVSGEARRIGRKIAVLNLICWIFVYTFLSYYCVPMYLGYIAIVKHSIKLGSVAAANSAQESVRNSLNAINYCMVEVQKVGQFAERFRRFLNYEIKIENKVGNEKVPDGVCELEVKDMSFRYDGATADTLKHINMTIKAGQRIALVGENGAGKTTFVKLLMRLYDVTDGSITYGGKDIRNFTTKEYREIFGTVFQDFQIYAVSLAENVLMNDWKEEYRDRITEALKKADFEKKLNRLDHGIETEMTREFSDDGTMLSGGEAQKVAISRMFYKKGKLAVAILDEPSSALDPRAEYTLNQNMMKRAEGASVIFISHRLSTTRDADCIYMFEHGQIVEYGNHEELIALGGEYAKMFEKQALYYQEEIMS